MFYEYANLEFYSHADSLKRVLGATDWPRKRPTQNDIFVIVALNPEAGRTLMSSSHAASRSFARHSFSCRVCLNELPAGEDGSGAHCRQATIDGMLHAASLLTHS